MGESAITWIFGAIGTAFFCLSSAICALWLRTVTLDDRAVKCLARELVLTARLNKAIRVLKQVRARQNNHLGPEPKKE